MQARSSNDATKPHGEPASGQRGSPDMASIKRREDGQWRARHRDDAGKEHARHFGRKVDAQRWIDETTAAVVTGHYVDPKGAKTTVRDYAEEWQATLVSREHTLRNIDIANRVHVLPHI